MFTFQGATALQDLFAEFPRAGTVSAAHGVSVLLQFKAEDGPPFLAGRRITSFANSEEDFADTAVGRKLMPFRIENEARQLGADFVAAPAFQRHAVRDGNLITGQQQHSDAETARLVIEALEEGGR
jgi:putative intracellular protease/amidase